MRFICIQSSEDMDDDAVIILEYSGMSSPEPFAVCALFIGIVLY